MSHWQRKLLHRLRRQFFWGKLLLVSGIGHAFLVFVIFFMYKGDHFSYDVTTNITLHAGSPVIFLPFHKNVQKKPIIDALNKKKASVTQSAKKIVKPKRKKTELATLKKPKPKPKKIAHKKKPSPPKDVPKVAEKLPKKESPIKTAQKKQEAKKQIKTAAKNVPKNDIRPNKKTETVAQKKKSQEQQPIYVGRAELEALRMQKEMQCEVSKHWKPPVALSKDLSCVLKLLVDWDGHVREAVVKKTSGVLVYDVSARTSVAQMNLPRWARGKEFTITFKQ